MTAIFQGIIDPNILRAYLSNTQEKLSKKETLNIDHE